MKKRILAYLLSATLVVGLVPATAWAEELPQQPAEDIVVEEQQNDAEGGAAAPEVKPEEAPEDVPVVPEEDANGEGSDDSTVDETEGTKEDADREEGANDEDEVVPEEDKAAPEEKPEQVPMMTLAEAEPVATDEAVIKVNGYRALEKAIAEAPEDGKETTITLINNISQGKPIKITNNKNIILDLGGYNERSTLYLDGATLTVKNGTIIAKQCIAVYGSEIDRENYSVLNVEKDVTLKGRHGIIVCGDSSNNYEYYQKTGYGTVVNVAGKITNGTIFVMGNLGNSEESYNAMANSQHEPVINLIDGANISGGDGLAIALHGYATVNVKDGATISGSEAIGVKRGNLNISGGTLIATGPGKDPIEANGSGAEETGAAVSVTGTYNKYGKINVSITGGELKSENQAAVFVGRSVKDGIPQPFTNGLTVNIEGGSFSGNPDSGAVFIAPKIDGDAEDYTQKVIEGGTFSESVKEYVDETKLKYELQNGSGDNVEFTYYKDLNDAKDAAKEGAVITDVTVTPDAETVTVTIKYHNGEEDTTLKTAKGATIDGLDTPVKSRYRFRGWTVGDSYISFPYEVEDSVIIEAAWKKKSSGSSGSSSSSQEYKVIIAEGIENGKVKVDPTKAEKGDKVTITVTPNKGYEINKVYAKDADGDKLELKDKGDGEYTFTMPDSKVEVKATFVKAEEEKPAEPEEIPAAEKIVLTVNEKAAMVFGNVVVNDVAPIIRNDRTMLPIRFVAKNLGAEVTWDAQFQKVSITKDDLKSEIIIGSPVAFVNGENVTLDSPAFIENSRTYLPLRFVAENLGATVLWDAKTQEVTIVPEKAAETK